MAWRNINDWRWRATSAPGAPRTVFVIEPAATPSPPKEGAVPFGFSRVLAEPKAPKPRIRPKRRRDAAGR